MTAEEKKKAWDRLREMKPAIDVVLGTNLSLSFAFKALIVTQRVLFEIALDFARMLEAAKNTKELSQAYRFAIAAGIYQPKKGRYSEHSSRLFNKWESIDQIDFRKVNHG